MQKKKETGMTMEDEAVKVFLSAEGCADEVTDEMKAFLDYLAGKKAESDFTEKLDAEVRKARGHKQWRQEYRSTGLAVFAKPVAVL